MRNGGRVVVTEGPEELAGTGADLIVGAARARSDRGDDFHMAISGGSTPRAMYRLLAEPPRRSGMPWERVHVFWVDERCVPGDDPASNYGAAKRDFLDSAPIAGRRIHAMPGSDPPEEGALRYERELVGFFGLGVHEFPVFDLVILGVGADGHTASLFPGHPAVDETERLVVAVRGGDPDIDRITLTLPVLNHAREILVLASGRDKAEVVRALTGKERPRRLPASRIDPPGGTLTWLLDRDSAG